MKKKTIMPIENNAIPVVLPIEEISLQPKLISQSFQNPGKVARASQTNGGGKRKFVCLI